MESNISRDHIALEAMKIIYRINIEVRQTLWNKISVLFGGEPDIKIMHPSTKMLAEFSYRIADAMIEEREKREKRL